MRKIILASMLILSACSLGKHKETSLYTIRAVNVPAHSCKLDLNLQVAEPTTSPGLDTRRIAVYENQQQLNFYGDVRWTAPVPEMLQAALIDGFEKSKAFKTVSTDMEAAKSDVILLTDIRRYQVEENQVNIRYISKLINAEDRKIITTIEVEKNQKPTVHKIDNIIETFADATNKSIKETVEKTLAAYPKCQ